MYKVLMGKKKTKKERWRKRKSNGESTQTPAEQVSITTTTATTSSEEPDPKRQKTEKYYDIYGPDARASVEVKSNNPISVRDLQQLILWVLTDNAVAPNWIFVKNKPLIQKAVVILVNTFPSEIYTKHKECFPFLSKLPSIGVKAPGDKKRIFSSAGVLLTCPTSKPKVQMKSSTNIEPPSYYILTKEQLKQNLFPTIETIDEKEREHWMKFTNKEPVKSNRAMLCIDCEMCETVAGLELTKVSVVDEELQVIYDTLVKPPNPIINYLTRYSGITEEKLQGVTKTLREVQEDLVQLIPEDTILVGHSFENDLTALKMFHDKIIDTSVLFPKVEGHKHSLRYLATKFLSRSIQEKEHDSIQDCIACMQLAQLKIKNGPSFGLSEEGPTVPLFTKLSGSSVMIDRPNVLNKNSTGSSVSCLPCTTDEEAFHHLEKSIPSQQFIFTQFYCLHEADVNAAEFPQLLSKLDKQLEEVHNLLSANSVMIVASGDSNLLPLKKLQNEIGTTNGSAEGELEKLIGYLRQGMAFITVKQ